MNPTAIYSKSGKGVQEAAGKTSLLTRPDRAVLSAIDGRATLADVAQKVGKTFDATFATLITTLDKNGFIREVSAGAGAAAAPRPAAAAPPKPAAAAPRSAGPASKAAAKPPEDSGADLDFSSLGTPATSKPASPPPPPPKEQQSALNKAREEAEAKAQAERDKLKKEVEAKARAEMEAKLRSEAEKKLKEEAEAKAKAQTTQVQAEAEAKVKAARDAALKAAEAKVRLEQESKAKLEAERKAREEAERKGKDEAERARKEAEEKARREAEDLRHKLEEERKARELAERRAKEEAERARKELEEERKRLEVERKREEEERAARRKREEQEAEARRKQREEEDRKADEERAAKQKQREEERAAREREEEEQRAAKKKQREEEHAAREQEEEAQREAARAAKQKQREEEEAAQAAVAKAAPAPAPKAEAKPPPKKDSFADSLLADLDNFTNKEEDEAKAKEEADRKAKAEAERQARVQAERQAKEEAERAAEQKRRAEEEARRREEEARRAAEEEERRAQEEERRKREAEEIQRKAEAATAAAMAKQGKKAPAKAAAGDGDIPVTEDDLDMDEVKSEQAALAKSQAKEKEKELKEQKKKRPVVDEPVKIRRPVKWGKPVAMTLGLILVIVVGGAQFVPLGTADYERAATEALGRPVKIGSANLWLLTGPQLRLHDVSVGDAKIKQVTAFGGPGAIFGDKKDFSRIELDGLTLPQEAIGDALFATVRGDNFSVEEIVVKSLDVPGPATLPKSLQAELRLDAKGAMRNAIVRGPDGLLAKIIAKEDGLDFDVHAAGFPLPIAPQVVLSNFAMRGSATRRGMTITEWAGAIFGGAISGTANVRWSGSWNVDGVVTVRNINAAVFAPTLLSSGNAEGTGKFSMNGPDAGALAAASRIDGNFTVSKGTLGSFDLVRAIQSSGKQYAGSTQFVEMNGRATYDRGAVSLRDITIGAGALNAGASADIAQNGALSGRIVADMRTAAQTLRGTLLLGGTVKEPQVRN